MDDDDSSEHYAYMKHVLRKTYYLLINSQQQNNIAAVVVGILIGFVFGCYFQYVKRFVRNQIWWAGTRLAASHYGAKAGGFVCLCQTLFLNCSSEEESLEISEKDITTNRNELGSDDVECKQGDSRCRVDDEVHANARTEANDSKNDSDDGIDREALRKEDQRESGVDPSNVPKHVAVIMDGNRRYGKAKFGNATQGHWEGSKKLVEFAKWCHAEGVEILTVYAFSTENWSRDAAEISALMNIFCKYCDEIRVEALKRGIRVKVLSTETEMLPDDVKAGLRRMVDETAHCTSFLMNICLSYGSRGEIVNACRQIASQVKNQTLDVDDIDEQNISNSLLTGDCIDPDVVIRTSGEMRLSNFLLWQLAYSEMFFIEHQWPEVSKEDLLEIIRSFACGRKRRYGR